MPRTCWPGRRPGPAPRCGAPSPPATATPSAPRSTTARCRCCSPSPTTGPQMRSHTTREFMAAVAIAQHFGRPHTPTDQAWIETLFGHIKGEWPHLEKITDPAELAAELDRVRTEYNTVRLHAGIGYVTRVFVFEDVAVDHVDAGEVGELGPHGHAAPCWDVDGFFPLRVRSAGRGPVDDVEVDVVDVDRVVWSWPEWFAKVHS